LRPSTQRTTNKRPLPATTKPFPARSERGRYETVLVFDGASVGVVVITWDGRLVGPFGKNPSTSGALKFPPIPRNVSRSFLGLYCPLVVIPRTVFASQCYLVLIGVITVRKARGFHLSFMSSRSQLRFSCKGSHSWSSMAHFSPIYWLFLAGEASFRTYFLLLIEPCGSRGCYRSRRTTVASRRSNDDRFCFSLGKSTVSFGKGASCFQFWTTRSTFIRI